MRISIVFRASSCPLFFIPVPSFSHLEVSLNLISHPIMEKEGLMLVEVFSGLLNSMLSKNHSDHCYPFFEIAMYRMSAPYTPSSQLFRRLWLPPVLTDFFLKIVLLLVFFSKIWGDSGMLCTSTQVHCIVMHFFLVLMSSGCLSLPVRCFMLAFLPPC